MSELFYLQDSRSYVGNDVLWWAQKGQCGYTTDLRKARVFTKEEAQNYHNGRESDIPWPKEYIDAKTRPAVDMQHINRGEALDGTGITLMKPQKPKPYKFNCGGCGRFLKDVDRYCSDCPNCGTDNRP
jgi:hypothetical protein